MSKKDFIEEQTDMSEFFKIIAQQFKQAYPDQSHAVLKEYNLDLLRAVNRYYDKNQPGYKPSKRKPTDTEEELDLQVIELVGLIYTIIDRRHGRDSDMFKRFNEASREKLVRIFLRFFSGEGTHDVILDELTPEYATQVFH